MESSLSDTGNVLSDQSEYLGTGGNYLNPQQVFEAFVAVNQPISTAFGVPESVKRKAWQGKNVLLYMFLPGFSEQESGVIQCSCQSQGRGSVYSHHVNP